MNRRTWKIYHRLQRIIVRESWKAYEDAVIFGTGAVKIDNETGEPHHVPFCELVASGVLE